MQKALAPDISTWPDDNPQLIGSTCGNCGATAFPVQPRCPRCSRAEMAEVLLPRRGTLAAWTTQGFPPGAPYKGPVGEDFVPFGVGLVQLEDVIRVEGRLT
ncbi:MAG TPA: OB-fold domain-containing protein, partial [Mycobacterium sp.]|nr:OB-fold domain-containing protein [Mycobacterium sp.]